MKFKVPYSSMPRVQFETVGLSLTRQSSKEECDINRIMARFEKTGVLEHRNTFEGQYGDFLDTPQDYHEAINQVMEAQEMFMSLPSGVRRRFGNDPAEYLDFVADPSNLDEMVRLGLATKRPDPSSVVDDEFDVEFPPPPKAPSRASKAPSSDPDPA